MSSQDWQARLVASLCRSKTLGHSWAYARRVAEKDVRFPRARVWAPSAVAVLDGHDPAEMTDEVVRGLGDYVELSEVESMWRFCEDAWFGRRPRLKDFSLSILEFSEDEARAPARRASAMGRAA